MWRPGDWTSLMLTASSTTTSPLTQRYLGADVHIAGLFDDFGRLIWFEWIFGSACPRRITSIESDEQPEPAGRGNPSLLSLSKNCLFLTSHTSSLMSYIWLKKSSVAWYFLINVKLWRKLTYSVILDMMWSFSSELRAWLGRNFLPSPPRKTKWWCWWSGWARHRDLPGW